MWVRFRIPAMHPTQFWFVEIRFTRQGGAYRVDLVDGTNGSIEGSLPKDWSVVAPRLRVRMRHQEMEGVRTIFLMVEDSTLWKADLSEPVSPDSTNTLSVPSSSFGSRPASAQFGFGNVISGVYNSDWEVVRVIRSSESDTFLPPPPIAAPTVPPTGTLVLVMVLGATAGLLLRSRRPTRCCSGESEHVAIDLW